MYIYPFPFTKGFFFRNSSFKLFDKLAFRLDWCISFSHPPATSRTIYSQCVLKISKNTYIIHNQTVWFILKNSVCPRYSLHQSVIPHWFIEIDCRKGLYVKACHPHSADKYNSKGVIWIFKFCRK